MKAMPFTNRERRFYEAVGGRIAAMRHAKHWTQDQLRRRAASRGTSLEPDSGTK